MVKVKAVCTGVPSGKAGSGIMDTRHRHALCLRVCLQVITCMARDEPTLAALRVELSNLRDDLAVIESSDVFAMNATGNQEAVDAIRHRIVEIESILARNDK